MVKKGYLNKNGLKNIVVFLGMVLVGYMCLVACSHFEQVTVNQKLIPTQNETSLIKGTTPVKPPTAQQTIFIATQTPTAVPQTVVWLDDSVPPSLDDQIRKDAKLTISSYPDQAQSLLKAGQKTGAAWVYTLVVPFPTVLDNISLEEIRRFWQGREQTDIFKGHPLLMTASTRSAFTSIWGEVNDSQVTIVDQKDILKSAWDGRPSWALIPFEELEPTWKVLKVDGVSPLDKNFDISQYPLVINFSWVSSGDEGVSLKLNQILPESNRDPNKMTVVVLTGTTALVRAIAEKMEINGMTYPAEGIGDWLREADFTHISNEIAFSPDCPSADPHQKTLRFCSRPEYMELLDEVDADIIDLTGNHLVDWSREAFLGTLQMYRQHGMQYYAGGVNLEEARRPLLIEHHGNRLAFIGCNLVGPPAVWASDTRPGNAACEDYAWVKSEIAQLFQNGYLPIVTLQHNEFFSLVKTPNQEMDFSALANAGAVVVSGSQAHYPNPFAFVNGRFIHYGLGNLFFDQMDYLYPGVQREFIDRHIFYNGRHISTEILTARLEDFSQPRPMTTDERAAFLREAFIASGWK